MSSKSAALLLFLSEMYKKKDHVTSIASGVSQDCSNCAQHKVVEGEADRGGSSGDSRRCLSAGAMQLVAHMCAGSRRARRQPVRTPSLLIHLLHNCFKLH
jgi:hypothetical protein